MKNLGNILSWIGIGLILVAYVLNVFGIVESRSVMYLSFNIIGSIFIIFHAFHRRDYQPAVLNIVWAAVAIINLVIVVM